MKEVPEALHRDSSPAKASPESRHLVITIGFVEPVVSMDSVSVGLAHIAKEIMAYTWRKPVSCWKVNFAYRRASITVLPIPLWMVVGSKNHISYALPRTIKLKGCEHSLILVIPLDHLEKLFWLISHSTLTALVRS